MLQGTASAQVPDSLSRARADSVARARAEAAARQDSLRVAEAERQRADSLRREDLRVIAAQRRRADSIKVPTPAAEIPRSLEVNGALSWDRASLFASGALTLGDLLERVPGVSLYRSGWLGSPEQGALAGDFGRLRIFQDGVELDALDPGSGGVIDLSLIQLWPLEMVHIERGAGEIRVHLRTWRVRSVTPQTRVDIGTGDAETNGYRGYFGRRFGAGQVLQVGGSQLTSRDPRGVGDLDQLSLFGRVGWARGRLAFDGAILRTGRERTEQPRLNAGGRADLPPLKVTNVDSYLRAAFTDTSSGLWAQLTAGRQGRREADAVASGTSGSGGATGSDQRVDRSQFVGAAGWGRGALAASLTARVRVLDSGRTVSTMARATYDAGRARLAILAEDRPDVEIRRVEATATLSPLSSLVLTAAAGRAVAGDSARRPGSTDLRAEVALRVRRLWIGAGALTRDTARLSGPVVFDTGFRSMATGAARGTFATLRGKVWRDIGIDVTAIMWDSAAAYRPKYQARTQLYLQTDMKHKFPSGNLGFLFALSQDYRSRVPFPVSASVAGGPVPPSLQSSEFRSYGILFEIKLLDATLTYQFRNLLNAPYEQVPGFVNMRAVQFYGVRWNFFN